MANTLMHIPKDNEQNYPLCRLQLGLDTQLTESTNLIVIVLKVVKPTNKKTLVFRLLFWVTGEINCLMSPPTLRKTEIGKPKKNQLSIVYSS